MGRVPQFLLVHNVSIERYVGDGAYGPTYDTAETAVPAFVQDSRRLVPDATGRQVVSSTTVILAPEVANVPAGSHVTLPSGRRARVITTTIADGGTLPTPDHVELMLE